MAAVAGTAALLSFGGAGALGASVLGASFSGAGGTASVGGTLYAKQGAGVTLAVTTDNAKCVVVSGAHTAQQSSASNKTSWSLSFTAGSGSGVQTVTVVAYKNFNQNSGNCTGDAGEQQGIQTASYTLDNAGPVVTGTKAPAANGAGWNRSDVAIDWQATDAGSGVQSGPTPAADAVTTDTGGVAKTATATDRLGNVGNGSVAVKRDATAPQIDATRSPAPNANGWNNGAVSVSFSCSDALSGIKSCPSPATLSADGSAQSAAGTATDNADNERSASVAAINIDTAAPSLSGAPATAPDGDDGWYRGDVAIEWTCADALSAIAGTCPADDTITGEGEGLTASATVADKAGNATSATSSPAVKIDRTPPTTSVSAAGGSWSNSDVTVTLDGDDALSGPDRTYYEIDAGQAQLYDAGAKPSFSQDGVHTLSFWTIDRAGNAEAHNSIEVRIDKTNPTIGHTLSPAANLAGWNNANTTVHFVCADPGGAGIAACTDDVVVATEGFNALAGTALDNAGNSASESFDVRLDKTAPSIVAAPDRAPNAAGWYRDDVTVSFTCADVEPAGVDDVSGLASCPAAQTLGEGAGQSAAGSAIDTAGNSASDALSGIDVDKTDPALTGAATTDPNANGWYSGAVTVAWSCSDALSGIDGDCPAHSTIDGEGDELSASRTVADKAGNAKSATVDAIRIDRTAPSTFVAVPDPLASGWYAGDVEVTLDGVDALSKVDTTNYSVDGGPAHQYDGPFTHALKGVHTIIFWSVDKAGNVEDREAPGHAITLRIDGTPPTIKGARVPQPNDHGWNSTPVTVAFDCSDLESGIASCEPPVVLPNEGADQSVTGSAVDVAGNEASDTVSDIDIDLTAPTLSGAPTTAANAAGWYKGDVTIRWTGADALSGIDPATAPADATIDGEGSNLGAGPVSVSDKAGNSATAALAAIKIDRAAPVISGAPTTSPNADGWYRSDVTVAFTCTDPQLADATDGSGVATCPSERVLQGDGAGQSVTSSPATDLAGNASDAKTIGAINIDGHEPQTAADVQCTATNDYCRGASATVVLTATDAGPSGVKEIHYRVGGAEHTASGATANVTVPLSGSGTASIAYWAIDRAGNVEPEGAAQLRYDNIAPVVTHTLNPTANAADWSKLDTTVHFGATDDFSGVDASSITPDVVVDAETPGQAVAGKADDMAGNTGTDAVTVKLDKTAPQISGAATASPNAAGWHSGPVTVQFACSDALSHIAVCPDDVTLTNNGAGQSVQRTAFDNAGNTRAATVGPINIDATKPSIDVDGIENGAIYTLGAVPAPSCDATDAVSAIAGDCTVTVTGGLANGVGTFQYSATARDLAGNSTTVTGSYRVIYRFDGYLQPINDTAHQIGVETSIFKAASTVPAKLQLRKADGTLVQANGLPAWLSPAKGGPTALTVDESLYSDAATSGATYRWDAGGQQYIYNWGTAKNQAGYYWRVGVKLDDGQTYTVNIGLR